LIRNPTISATKIILKVYRRKIKYFLLSVGICLTAAILGKLLSGDSLQSWYPTLQKPRFALPLWGWFIVAGVYYLLLIIILDRILNFCWGRVKKQLLTGALLLIIYNEFWNFLFLGLSSTAGAFFGLLPFVPIVMWFSYLLYLYDRKSFWIFSPYLLWLGYDILWTYQLWRMN